MRHGAGVLGLLLSATPTDKSSQVLSILQQVWLPTANAILQEEGYRVGAKASKFGNSKSIVVTVYSTAEVEDPPPPYSPP